MNVIVCFWLNEGLCHQHSQRAGRGTIDYRMSSRSPQVAKFKTGNGVSRTEIHRGSREATASKGKGGRQHGEAQWVPCCRYVSLGIGPMVIED